MQSPVECGDVLSGGGGAVPRLGELQSALSEERTLIEDLGQVLLRQREGVAAHDPEVIEAAVHALSRTLLTLEEARRRRTALITLVIGKPGVPLEDLQRHLGTPLPPGFMEAREGVRSAGEAIAADVAINQDVLWRALEAGEAFRQQLFSGGALPHSMAWRDTRCIADTLEKPQ
jgi:hypothetical protein